MVKKVFAAQSLMEFPDRLFVVVTEAHPIHPMIVHFPIGRKTLRQMAERISQISTVSSADTMAALEALLTTIPQELAAGNIVELVCGLL